MGRRTTRRSSGVATPTAALPPDRAAFVHHYIATGGNGTRAYLAAFPNCKSIAAAAASAYRLLHRAPAVQAAIDAVNETRWTQLHMSGDEVLARIALDARADIRELYDEDGDLLPIRQWPDSVAQSVKAIRQTKDGTVTVILNDSAAARKLIAEQTGKLKNPLAGVGDLARILAGDFEEDE